MIFATAAKAILGQEIVGPGTSLARLLKRLGIEIVPSCSCEDYALQMNVWGVKGCWLRLDEIVKRVKANKTWRKTIKVIFGLMRTGLIFRIWSVKGLVKYAIRKSEYDAT